MRESMRNRSWDNPKFGDGYGHNHDDGHHYRCSHYDALPIVAHVKYDSMAAGMRRQVARV